MLTKQEWLVLIVLNIFYAIYDILHFTNNEW